MDNDSDIEGASRDNTARDSTHGGLARVADLLIERYRQQSSLRHELAAHMAEFLRLTRWPGDEQSRHERIREWGRALARMSGGATNDEAREVVRTTIALLARFGLLATEYEVQLPESDPASARAIAELGQIDDPIGAIALQRAQRDIVTALTTNPLDVDRLEGTVAASLCLAFAASDAIATLAAARWDDIDWGRMVLAVPRAVLRRGHVVAASARYVVLSPLTCLALAALHANRRGDERIFASSATSADTESSAAQITAALRRHGPTEAQHRPVVSRLARQLLAGWVVEAAIDDVEGFTPLDNDDALQILVDSHFAADLPVDYRGDEPPSHGRARSTPLPASIVKCIASVQDALPKKGNLRSKVQRKDAAKLLHRQAAELLAEALAEPTPPDPEALYPALLLLFRRIDEHRDAATRRYWALLANTACVTCFLAYRIERQSGSGWLERSKVPKQRGQAARRTKLVAPETIREYAKVLYRALQAIGDLPLTRWSDTEWAAIESTASRYSTIQHRHTIIGQLGDFAREQIGTSLQVGWPRRRDGRQNVSVTLPRPGQIIGMFEELKRNPDRGEDALLLVSAMLGFGLREAEAAHLFASEIDGASAYIAPDAAKGGKSRRAPLGWLPQIGLDALEQRQRAAVAEDKKSEPWLLHNVKDYKATISFVQRTMARWGFHPHTLRHCHITWYQLAVIAYRQESAYAWPTWVLAAAQERDALRTVALGAGHSTTRTTRSVYTQLHFWLIARAWRQREEAILTTIVSKRALGNALAVSPGRWDRALRAALDIPTDHGVPARITLAEAFEGWKVLG